MNYHIGRLILSYCVLEILVRLVLGGVSFAGFSFSLQNKHHPKPATPNLQHTGTENKTTDVAIHQHSRKLLMMDILMSEIC